MAKETAIKKGQDGTARPEPTRTGRAFAPPVDIVQEDDQLVLLADVPGAKADGIEINYERGVLTLHATVGPRQDETMHYLLQEYQVGDYSRTFQVSADIDAARISAELKDGVLNLQLPKTGDTPPRRITVQVS